MRSNGPVATKELAMTGREWPGGQLASHIDLQGVVSIRPQIVRDQLVWDKSILLQKLAHGH